MAGAGGIPSGRQRQRNKAIPIGALLPPMDTRAHIPKLPPHPNGEWNSLTLRWWKTVWQSPMRAEYTDTDTQALWTLAMVVNDFWNAETAKERRECSAEIRLQSVRFGLSPIDRSRLRWEIERTEEAEAKGRERQNRQVTGAPQTADPRAARKAG